MATCHRKKNKKTTTPHVSLHFQLLPGSADQFTSRLQGRASLVAPSGGDWWTWETEDGGKTTDEMTWDEIHQGKSKWHSYHVLVYISPVLTYLFGAVPCILTIR